MIVDSNYAIASIGVGKLARRPFEPPGPIISLSCPINSGTGPIDRPLRSHCERGGP